MSGSNQPHVLWNRVGRQRILKHLKTQVCENLAGSFDSIHGVIDR